MSITGLRPSRGRRPLAVSAAALLLAAMVAAFAPASAAPTGGDDRVMDNVTGRAASSYTATKPLTRVFENADGTTYEFPTNTVTVNASETENLRGRQRITISWSGAQPSGGRASNPYGENGLQQEYPVVVLQCRGRDDASLPPEQQVRPETCWTASVAQRSQITRSEAESTWTHDRQAAPADKERVSGLAPFPGKEICPTADQDPFFTRLTPFVAKSGKLFEACDSAHMAPEAAVDAAFPAAEIAAFSDAEGAGSVEYEVRSDVENESLGCNHKVECSIVVIPINGLSCDAPAEPATIADDACRKGGRFAAGSSNFSNEGVDQAVSPALWWSASNWANRFSIPITFGLPPDTCDILDPRPPTGFYGSELLAQASLQWSPAYCLDKKRFKFQHNQMSDEAGWNLMESGGGVAAVVSSKHERRGDAPVAYAPTAVTGFSIGYVIDRPDNAGEFTDLRLNARLIAKLMTQSYLGSDLGRGHPGMGANPLGIMNDPEFIALNPGLSQNSQEAGAALLSLSNSSDVIEQLTDYLAHDKAAMDFVAGKVDPWGMKVNPNYKKIKLPRAEWPLLDDYIPQTENACRQNNPAVYFTQLAAPVTAMRKIAEALLDGWPNVQTRCDVDLGTGGYKLGRIDRQSFGARFMLGIVSLGDVERYGLRSAALETKSGQYVAPSEASLGAAVALTEQKKDGDPFLLDQGDVRKSGKAYPGTMVVYTAAKTADLPAEEATKVAQFIRVSTTEGQRPGTGNGELPAGFLPIKKSGVTAKLHNEAQRVAAAVEKQTPVPTETPSSSTPPPTGGAGTPVTPPPPAPSAGEVPSVAPSASPSATPTESATAGPVAMPPTDAVSSDLGGRLLPGLLVIGLLGIAVASAVRFFVQPPPGPRP
jgi:hypothetical protein